MSIKSSNRVLESAVSGEIEWIMVRQNDEKTIKRLKTLYQYHDIDLEDTAPPIQSPKFSERETYSFLILQYPVMDKKKEIIHSVEIDFFIEKNRLITVDVSDFQPLQDLFTIFKQSEKQRAKKPDAKAESVAQDIPHLIYLILNDLTVYTNRILRRMSVDIEKLEPRMFNEFDSKLIKDLLHIKMNVVNTRKSMQSHWESVSKLFTAFHGRFRQIHSLEVYFQQIIDDNQDIWSHLELQKDTINALQETTEALSGYRINEIMKTLTIVSFTILPLTLIAGIFGMNAVNMPLVNHPLGFWFIIGILLSGCFCMLGFFKYKHWI